MKHCYIEINTGYSDIIYLNWDLGHRKGRRDLFECKLECGKQVQSWCNDSNAYFYQLVIL